MTRISASQYSDKFVLKGGLYLSSILGIENRFTVDIDFIVRKLSLERESIINTMKEICALPADDNVTFTYIGDSEIKKDDIYGGFSISLEGRLENIRQRFDVDVATNDVVYPHDLDYSYTCLLTNEAIQIKSYSVESVIAEKMQTFLSKGVLNSRAKDFYDLYALSMQKEKYKNNLRITFEKTCKSREYETSKDEALGTLHLVESSKAQRQRWQAYAKKMKYAKNISFDDTIQSIEKLIDVLF